MTVQYTSADNWTRQRDILRCNPLFYGRKREDTVIIQGPPGELWFGRLKALFRLASPHPLHKHGIAMVQYFDASDSQAATDIRMRTVQESQKTEFIFLTSVVRACHVIPQFGDNRKPTRYYVNDLVDGDMLLRLRR